MAGAGYKLFNTGDVLTAQQVNEYLQQQTVMVFADSTARTTALSGVLAEGMLSYLKDTDATEVYNGSAWVALAADQTPLTTKGDLFTFTTTDARLASSGVNGDILTVDTSTASGLKWAAPTGAGANWSLLNSGGTALTGAQTITVSGISAKDKIMILVTDASSANASSNIAIRLNTDTNSNYFNYGIRFTEMNTWNGAAMQSYSSNDNAIQLGQMYANAIGSVTGYCLITGCNASGVKVFNAAGTGNQNADTKGYVLGGYYNSSSTISSISIYSSTGNFDAGTVYVYTSA